jgi:hypothetical protein
MRETIDRFVWIEDLFAKRRSDQPQGVAILRLKGQRVSKGVLVTSNIKPIFLSIKASQS